ncbi:hypothetical protein LSH36_228g03003 [Paralvinella palmiformis]|uniref:HAT C-terminal dimerisation domain-containing protein n=1 Tax=Paralvinella palmiformis TaxID=53620 RepID=A0AAD9N577_9ANNE|nr:hypothetical protein LSH36_228g03003 [Paralvinella palmiformis]
MFQGHPIDETFSCGETKCRYLCQFGPAPHFSSLLKSRINKDSEYVLLFDESMNKKTKNKQLDIHVRLWHHDQVHTRYLTSQFIGYAAATDLLEHFNASTSDLRRNGLLQNIGSCALHVIRGAFQTGVRETGWGLDGLLSSPYYLFKDTSARRDDFTDVTGCNEFPLIFCKQRCVENGPVCSSVLLLWHHLKSFVEACETKRKAKPTSNSYNALRDAMNDKLSVAKLSFFKSAVKYRLARNMACLDPKLMVSDQEHSKSKCKRLLEELVTLNRVDGDDVDMLVASYKELLHDVAGCELKSMFKDFKVEDDRVDMLLYECMGRNKKFEKLWRVVRKVLLVSHGQASVERGFSLNRQIEKDNMSKRMIVALRQIIDYFVLVGGMLKVEITKELLSSASSSRYRYHQYLEEDKRKKGQEAIQRKRKTVQDEVDDLKKRKKFYNLT